MDADPLERTLSHPFPVESPRTHVEPLPLGDGLNAGSIWPRFTCGFAGEEGETAVPERFPRFPRRLL